MSEYYLANEGRNISVRLSPPDGGDVVCVAPHDHLYGSRNRWNAGGGQRIVDCLNAMAGIDDPVHALSVLREGLAFIRDAHIPDQPADAAGDELVWAQRHVAKLRSEARALLSRIGGGE